MKHKKFILFILGIFLLGFVFDGATTYFLFRDYPVEMMSPGSGELNNLIRNEVSATGINGVWFYKGMVQAYIVYFITFSMTCFISIALFIRFNNTLYYRNRFILFFSFLVGLFCIGGIKIIAGINNVIVYFVYF